MKYLIIILFTTIMAFQAFASDRSNPPEVGIVQYLDEQVPLDLKFTDSDGKQIRLGEIVDKPTVLALVYYRCPGICSPILTEISSLIDQTDLVPGEDYQIITVSFDHSEDAPLAKKWKKEYLSGIKKPFKPEYWKFMVGDSTSIRKLSDAVGFYFKPDGEGDFIHAGAIMFLTPKGKIARYLLGTKYLPFDFKMSVIEASKGKSMPTASRLLEYCFSYDPEGESYVFNFTKVIGTVILVSIGIFFVVLVVKGRSKKTKNKESENDSIS